MYIFITACVLLAIITTGVILTKFINKYRRMKRDLEWLLKRFDNEWGHKEMWQ